MAAAIAGLTDVIGTGPTQTATDPLGKKQFPKLTPAQSAANIKAAGATAGKTDGNGNPITGVAGGSLDKNAFLKLLVQEMTNQDPLKPADNTQFIAQLAQFSTLEQMQNMNTGFKSLQTSFQTAQARGLLGVSVKAISSATGAVTDGKVDQIILNSDGTVQLDVNGTPVALTDVVSVGDGASSTLTGGSGSTLPGTLVPPTAGSGH